MVDDNYDEDVMQDGGFGSTVIDAPLFGAGVGVDHASLARVGAGTHRTATSAPGARPRPAAAASASAGAGAGAGAGAAATLASTAPTASEASPWTADPVCARCNLPQHYNAV